MKKMSANKNSVLVFSTNPERENPQEENHASRSINGQNAYIECDRKGRKGKNVTVISGLDTDLKALKKDLQQLCGCGGSVKNGTVEIQGDHRTRIAGFLGKKGVKVKYKGG